MDHIGDLALDLGIFALDIELLGSMQNPRDTTIFTSLKEPELEVKMPSLPSARLGD
jgi:hypothetical protein